MRKRRLVPVGLAVLTGAVYLAVSPGSSPVSAAADTPVLWSQETTAPESGEIFVGPAGAGFAPTRLTNDAADDKWPVLSFDGVFAAHVGNEGANEARAIIVRRVDGTTPPVTIPIEGNANSLQWSPTDYRLAFNDTDAAAAVVGGGDVSDVYVFNVTTSTLLEISDEDNDNDGTATATPADDPYDDAFPMWSPDGTRLAWFAEPDHNDTTVPIQARDQSEIMVANADNSGTTLRLTDNDYDDNWPWWSPDSTQLVWGGEVVDADDACGGAGQPACTPGFSDLDPDLFVGSAAGPVNSGTQITSDANVPNPCGAANPCGPTHPEWSPDGSKIAFAVGVDEADGDGAPSETWVVNPNGTGAQMLTNDGSRHFMWDPSAPTPGGALLLAVYHFDNGSDSGAPLGVFDANAPATPEVVLSTRASRWFDWSFDGVDIAYSGVPAGTPAGAPESAFEIFVETPAGGNERRVTTNNVRDTQPDFSLAASALPTPPPPPPPPPPPAGGGGVANRPPVAQDLAVNTPAGQSITISLQAVDPDGDPITFSIVGAPANGTLSIVNGNQVTYTPRSGFTGSDSFTYRARDGQADSNTATVRVTVQAPPPPPPTDALDYRMAAGDGGVFAFGDSDFLGTAGHRAAQVTTPTLQVLAQPIVGIAHDPADAGYWLTTGEGRVFNFGVPSLGSLAGRHLNGLITSIAGMPSGRGYAFVGEDGGVFSFGNAKFFGSMGGRRLGARIVDIEFTPSGNGYYLLGEDGGVFAFGDARFRGAALGRGSPAVGIAVAPDGSGYWIAFANGAVANLGVRSFGSMEGRPLNRPVVGIAVHDSGLGYWLAASDGGLFAFGRAPFRGSVGNGTTNTPGPGCCKQLNEPMVDIAS